MAFPVSDDFNRTNSADLGANWSVPTGGTACKIDTNRASTSGTLAFEYWNADTPGNNQYAECKTPIGSKFSGPAVRISTTSKTAYYYDVGGKQLFKNIAGTETSILAVTDASPSATALYRLSATGSLLSVYKAGTLLGSATDASLSSGRVGIYVYSSSEAVEDWAAGEIATQAATADNSTQANTSTSGDIAQTQIVAAANSTQVNASTSGAVIQEQTVTAANSIQVNESTSDAIGMPYTLSAVNSIQINLSTIGAVTQNQPLTAANSVQVNLSNSGKMLLTPGFWYPESDESIVWANDPDDSTTWSPSPPITSIWS